MASLASKRRRENDSDDEDYLKKLAEEIEDDYVPVKERKSRLLQSRRRQVAPAEPNQDSTAQDNDATDLPPPPPRPAAATVPHRSETSLLKATAAAKQNQPVETEKEREAKEEKELMESFLKKQALRSAQENALGTIYTEPLKTGWTPPSWIARRTSDENQRIRDKLRITAIGDEIAPPIPHFAPMRLPKAIIAALKDEGIKQPTPIQAQGLPVILSGRDCVGISYTGSGKTLVFALPMLLMALQEEWRMPLQEGEGPVGIVVCPSRELARQTHNITVRHAEALAAAGWPETRHLLCVGGEDIRNAGDMLRRGVHTAVCTPGRLKDFLEKRRMNLDICRYMCLDEADRMVRLAYLLLAYLPPATHHLLCIQQVDTGFEEDLREIISYFKAQRQTVMFSATMPDKIRAFAASALVKPVTVNVSRAGAANLSVLQEVEYVKAEDKLARLADCLQKTAPPVLVFAEKTRDVDMVHEYLLTRGVNAVAIHGGKDQQERVATISSFKSGAADVMCATDIAGKGLDFDGIQHVINFDMPEEIENYVHRIGRTGRRGRTGLATTFVSLKDNSEIILLDLKYLLKESKQPIPPVLQAIEDPVEMLEQQEGAPPGAAPQGCAYCGGLGHRVQNCPKLHSESRQAQQRHRPEVGGRGMGGDI